MTLNVASTMAQKMENNISNACEIYACPCSGTSQMMASRVPGAGSFIRFSQNIYFGNSFLEALKSKYIEPFHGIRSQEVIILGSSQGAVQVEAVNLDKVRNKLARLSSLREVSLEGVAKVDPQGMIGTTCPSEGTA